MGEGRHQEQGRRGTPYLTIPTLPGKDGTETFTPSVIAVKMGGRQQCRGLSQKGPAAPLKEYLPFPSGRDRGMGHCRGTTIAAFSCIVVSLQ
jgi:hypothetical protein